MNAPEITKLTREEVDSLFDISAKRNPGPTGTLKSLGLIELERGSYRLTKAGRERLKRERVLRARDAKSPETRREELEAARLAEVAKERQQRIAAAQKRVITAQKKREADEEKLKARKKAEQLQIAA